MKTRIVLKIIVRKSWLILLWSVSITTSLLMIGQFSLWKTVIWLGTPAGQNYVQELMPSEVAQIPYKLSFDTKDLPDKRLGVHLSARIMDKPVEVKAQLAYVQNDIILETFIVQAPDIKINGSGRFNTAKSALSAKLSGTIDSLQNYSEWVGRKHTIEPLSFDVSMHQLKHKDPVVTFDVSTQEYSNRSINLTARGVALKGEYVGGVVSISSLTARDHDKGTLSASGTFEPTGSMADIKITAREVNLVRGGIANGVLDGDLTFQGDTSKGYDLKGAITTQKMDITVPNKVSGNLPELNVQVQGQKITKTPPIADNIRLDLRINAPRRVIVRGRGLDAEFGGALDVKGTAAKPLYYGNLESLRGRYSEFGKVFKLTRANLNFSGSVPPSPTLDIEVKSKAGDITAIIAITGYAKSPKINFSSVPALPEDEVLSHILFGEGLESLTPFQAVQLAQTLARFTGQGGGASGLDPISTLRNLTGLDDLRFEMNEDGGASVGAGKYLSDNVYLKFETGTEEGSGNANVEVELTPNITLESEIGQDASGGAGLFWKWDY